MHPRKNSCGWTSAILVMTMVERGREFMQRTHAGRCLVTTAKMESWRIALLPKYLRNGRILLLVKKSSTTSLNHCYRKLNYLNQFVKACESLQRQLQLFSCTPSTSSFLCGKLFALRHQRNLYSCYGLGSSLVPGNLISDEMIKFRENL